MHNLLIHTRAETTAATARYKLHPLPTCEVFRSRVETHRFTQDPHTTEGQSSPCRIGRIWRVDRSEVPRDS